MVGISRACQISPYRNFRLIQAFHHLRAIICRVLKPVQRCFVLAVGVRSPEKRHRLLVPPGLRARLLPLPPPPPPPVVVRVSISRAVSSVCRRAASFQCAKTSCSVRPRRAHRARALTLPLSRCSSTHPRSSSSPAGSRSSSISEASCRAAGRRRSLRSRTRVGRRSP